MRYSMKKIELTMKVLVIEAFDGRLLASLMSWFFEILLPREIFIKHQSDSVTLSRRDIGYGQLLLHLNRLSFL